MSFVLDLKPLLEWGREACRNFPVSMILAGLGMCALIFIILDAHRHKKHRPRHRINK